MHIKIDEDLPPAVARMLRERGYASSTVLDQGMSGWKDPNEDGIRPLLELMEQFLASVPDLTQLMGVLAVVSPQGLRIRRGEV